MEENTNASKQEKKPTFPEMPQGFLPMNPLAMHPGFPIFMPQMVGTGEAIPKRRSLVTAPVDYKNITHKRQRCDSRSSNSSMSSFGGTPPSKNGSQESYPISGSPSSSNYRDHSPLSNSSQTSSPPSTSSISPVPPFNRPTHPVFPPVPDFNQMGLMAPMMPLWGCLPGNSVDQFPGGSIAGQAISQAGPIRRQRSAKKPIPSEQKDEKYYERRKRNNLAAKKSRDTKKMKGDALLEKKEILEIENAKLKAESVSLRGYADYLNRLLKRTERAEELAKSRGQPPDKFEEERAKCFLYGTDSLEFIQTVHDMQLKRIQEESRLIKQNKIEDTVHLQRRDSHILKYHLDIRQKLFGQSLMHQYTEQDNSIDREILFQQKIKELEERTKLLDQNQAVNQNLYFEQNHDRSPNKFKNQDSNSPHSQDP